MLSGHQARLCVVGTGGGGRPPGVALSLSLGHVVEFLQDYIREHWEVLGQAQFKDPAFGFLITLEKARRDGRATRRGVE